MKETNYLYFMARLKGSIGLNHPYYVETDLTKQSSNEEIERAIVALYEKYDHVQHPCLFNSKKQLIKALRK